MSAAHKCMVKTSEGVSVVGPAPTPSSVCAHCLSGSCDQHRGHKEVGTLLNSPGQELLGVNCYK